MATRSVLHVKFKKRLRASDKTVLPISAKDNCLVGPRPCGPQEILLLDETCLHPLLAAQDHRLGAEQDQLPCEPTETSSGNCPETETSIIRYFTRHDSVSKTIFQGSSEGGQRRGRQRRCWMDRSKSGGPCPYQNCL